MCRWILLVSSLCAGMLAPLGELLAEEPKAADRGILVRRNQVTPDILASWRAKGTSAVVVTLDEATKPG